jgi:hypothetical protein
MITDIQPALEVKSATLRLWQAPVWNSELEVWTSTDSHHGHCLKDEIETYTKSYKAKLEWLRWAELTRHDQAVKLLDMPMIHKPIAINFKHF